MRLNAWVLSESLLALFVSLYVYFCITVLFGVNNEAVLYHSNLTTFDFCQAQIYEAYMQVAGMPFYSHMPESFLGCCVVALQHPKMINVEFCSKRGPSLAHYFPELIHDLTTPWTS